MSVWPDKAVVSKAPMQLTNVEAACKSRAPFKGKENNM